MSEGRNPGWGCGPIFLMLLGGGVAGFVVLSVLASDAATLQISAAIGALFGAYCLGAKKGLLACAGAIIIALAFATISLSYLA